MRAILLGGLLASFISAAHAQSVEETVAFMLNGDAMAEFSPGTAKVVVDMVEPPPGSNLRPPEIVYSIDGCKIKMTLTGQKPDGTPSSFVANLDLSKLYNYDATVKPPNGLMFSGVRPSLTVLFVSLEGRESLVCPESGQELDGKSLPCDKSWKSYALFDRKDDAEKETERLKKAYAYYKENFCKGTAF